jgi:hypothetical protein
LVPDAPLAPDEVGGEDEDQLAYEFHDWAYESRRMLDQLLTGRGIVHSWQGASMIVRAVDEDTVDELVEEVEHATLPTLDPELEHVVYEMAGWSAEQQSELSDRLGINGVAHEFDANGDLVAHAADEARIEAILDDIEETGLSDDGQESVELDGLDVNELLSKVFNAADRVRRNARDGQGVLGLLDHAPLLARISTPYGFERQSWVAIVELAGKVHELLEDDDSDDDEIEATAQRLRDALITVI